VLPLSLQTLLFLEVASISGCPSLYIPYAPAFVRTTALLYRAHALFLSHQIFHQLSPLFAWLPGCMIALVAAFV
jgi:hypothetical protein